VSLTLPADANEDAVATTARRRRPAVSARAILLSVALTPLNILFLVHANWSVGYFTGGESLFANTVGILFLMVLGNQVLKRLRPKAAFAPGEMLTVYVLLGMGTGLTAGIWDVGGALASNITYPFWFASDSNGWRETVWPNLPTWLTVRDPSVLEGFYLGRSSAYSWFVIKAWLVPALWWAALIGALMWVCLCINSIVRRRWEDEEKLSFPVTILPVQLVAERANPLRSKLFWVGAGIAAVVTVWNTLAGISPSLPSIPVVVDYGGRLPHPWSFIRTPAIDLSPWIVGLCYLIPVDMAFSLLVFDLLWMAEYAATGYLGWSTDQWGGFPYGDEQATGGLLALALFMAWLDRRYLAAMLKQALSGRGGRNSAGQEAFSYRVALLGAIGGTAFLWVLLAKAGMTAWVAPVFLLLYFMLALVMSRFRAQLGAPSHGLHLMMPNYILSILVGTRLLGSGTLSLFALMGPYLREQRNNPVPLQLEALKMAEGGRMERPRIAWALAAIVPLAMLCYFWASIHLGYQFGLGTSATHRWNVILPEGYFWRLDSSLRDPSGMDEAGAIAVGVGLLLTGVLMFLKTSFPWWPLYPVAFPLANNSAIVGMTVAIAVTWVTKTLLLRYGGLKLYRSSLPLFLGLLAGGGTTALLQRLLWDALGLHIIIYN